VTQSYISTKVDDLRQLEARLFRLDIALAEWATAALAEWRERLPLLSAPSSTTPKPRERKPSLARLVAKARQLGMDVTIEPNGAVTFRCSSTASDAGINEWDEVLPRHGTH
jgi:hypothetical protein